MKRKAEIIREESPSAVTFKWIAKCSASESGFSTQGGALMSLAKHETRCNECQ